MDVKAKTILVADDDESLRRVLEFRLQEQGYQVVTAADGNQALELFINRPVDCVITDLRMPELSGMELLNRLNAVANHTPVIIITAYGDITTAVEAMRAGAFDFIAKPFNHQQVKLTIDKALAYGAMHNENRRLRRLAHERLSFENIIGTSPKMQQVFERLTRIAATHATTLIYGESGTGKELMAKAIHYNGARRDKAFVAVNCAALPEQLIEAELFGYRRGSFTNAYQDQKGKFEEADGGTLFLDEISLLPLSAQAKLLRVLQEAEVTRIGESRPRKIDVRIIAATNRSLRVMVEDEAFRGDLYFRLAVIPLDVPPLRERREDIPLLAEQFLQAACARHRCAPMRIAREVFAAFATYSFPGNVRELENLIERVVVLANGDTVTLEDLPDEIRRPAPHAANVLLEMPPDGLSIEAVERDIIRRALEMHDGNQTRTARYLDITRSALIYRMQKYHLNAHQTITAH